MKKSLIALVTTAVLSTPALAVDYDWFVGGGAAWQRDAIEGSLDKDNNDTSYQVRGGVILEDTHRLTFTYSYNEDDFNHDGNNYSLYQNLYLASYDYIYQLGQSDFNLFAGVSMGLADNKFTGNSHTDFVYGGQVGAQYELTDAWSIELGYRYLEQDYDASGIKVVGDHQLNDTQQLYTSIDYRF